VKEEGAVVVEGARGAAKDEAKDEAKGEAELGFEWTELPLIGDVVWALRGEEFKQAWYPMKVPTHTPPVLSHTVYAKPYTYILYMKANHIRICHNCQ